MKKYWKWKKAGSKFGLVVLCILSLSGCGECEAAKAEKAEPAGTVIETSESLSGVIKVVESVNVVTGETEAESVLTEEAVTVKMEEAASDIILMAETEAISDKHPYDFNVCFAGDINLDEKWSTTQFLNQQENGIRDCISEELLTHMIQADVMCLNNEFTYSLGGAPLRGKMYTFRAKPERVRVLQEMGVDIVKLANNHVYDYGPEALYETFSTLKLADIKYVGAGHNLEEAMAPVYMEVDGKTIAFVAASRAEKNKMTPQATATSPGILRCYDTTLFLETIAEAKANADFVLAYVHWGTEYSYKLENVQLTTGKQYLDAGADVVIGAHSHCLQGMEYYNGKPVIYSLGNFWFNEKTLDTMLLDLHFYGDDDGGKVEVQVIPAIQSGCSTKIVTQPEEQERIYSLLEEISINVEIDSEGFVREKY